jgi:FtsZ-interacting cell division protein YlmF
MSTHRSEVAFLGGAMYALIGAHRFVDNKIFTVIEPVFNILGFDPAT